VVFYKLRNGLRGGKIGVFWKGVINNFWFVIDVDNTDGAVVEVSWVVFDGFEPYLMPSGGDEIVTM